MCPGAPFLVEGTAAGLANLLSPVVRACRAAIGSLPEHDLRVLVTTGRSAGPAGNVPAIRTEQPESEGEPGHRLFVPGTVIRTSSLRRSDLPDRPETRLSGESSVSGGIPAALRDCLDNSPPSADAGSLAPSVGTIVGAHLLATIDSASADPGTVADPANADQRGADPSGADPSGAGRPPTGGHSPTPVSQPPTVAIEVTDPIAAAKMLSGITSGPERVAILVIADGAACHGDDAPGRRDDRSGPFDAALARALGTGDPHALLEACEPDLADGLLATVTPLEVLALLTEDAPPVNADLLFAGAPRGVGYLICSWAWTPPAEPARHEGSAGDEEPARPGKPATP